MSQRQMDEPLTVKGSQAEVDNFILNYKNLSHRNNMRRVEVISETTEYKHVVIHLLPKLHICY